MITYFVVQSFDRSKKGVLVPDQPAVVKNGPEAVAKAKRLSAIKAGVIAFARSGDETTGDYQDAVVLARFGDLPEDEEEAKVA